MEQFHLGFYHVGTHHVSCYHDHNIHHHPKYYPDIQTHLNHRSGECDQPAPSEIAHNEKTWNQIIFQNPNALKFVPVINQLSPWFFTKTPFSKYPSPFSLNSFSRSSTLQASWDFLPVVERVIELMREARACLPLTVIINQLNYYPQNFF